MATLATEILVALLSFTIADAAQVKNCLAGNSNSMLGVELSNCVAPPCVLQKNTTFHIEIKFKPDHEVKQLKHSVFARLAGMSMPFLGVNDMPACDHVYQRNKETKAGCPLAAGTEYVYKYHFDVLSMYPSIGFVVHWALEDVDQHRDVTCFEIPAKIVPKAIK